MVIVALLGLGTPLVWMHAYIQCTCVFLWTPCKQLYRHNPINPVTFVQWPGLTHLWANHVREMTRCEGTASLQGHLASEDLFFFFWNKSWTMPLLSFFLFLSHHSLVTCSNGESAHFFLASGKQGRANNNLVSPRLWLVYLPYKERSMHWM